MPARNTQRRQRRKAQFPTTREGYLSVGKSRPEPTTEQPQRRIPWTAIPARRIERHLPKRPAYAWFLEASPASRERSQARKRRPAAPAARSTKLPPRCAVD